MAKEWIWAAVSAVVIGAIGILLLYLGASGVMPKGFGLFDMSNLGVRAVVVVILVVAAIALFFAYRSTSKSSNTTETRS
jgi:multisubunit Na+/H+ antiporter MnhB subunit